VFQLSLIDHIRLSFGSVVTSYRAHARAAERLSLRAWQARVVVAILLALATGASFLALAQGQPVQIAAAALSVSALLGYTIVVSLDFDSRAYAHRACAARLWLLGEKYRALLAEVHDGLIEMPDVTARRDALMREVQAVYENALPADRHAYEIAREALGTAENAPSDQDIDRSLPASLKRSRVSGTT
jgi:hypothetical protein